MQIREQEHAASLHSKEHLILLKTSVKAVVGHLITLCKDMSLLRHVLIGLINS